MGRILLLSALTLLLGVSLTIAIIALCNKQWETVTASLSLAIAIVSAWVAYEVFYRQDQALRPQLVLYIDADSRPALLQLVCKNAGEKPAFNIKIEWDQPLLGRDGNILRFNKFDTGSDIQVLNGKESASSFISSDYDFYKNGRQLDYSGNISFQESIQTTRKITQSFYLSFKNNSSSLMNKNEISLTMNELQKVPKALDNITKELKGIIAIIKKQ